MGSVVDVPKPEKGLTDEQKEHLRGILQPIVNERFSGNATQAAKAMRLTQPQISQILLGSKSARGAGVSALVRIRAYTRIAIDDLLGLPPLREAAPADEFTSRYRGALAELEQLIERQRSATTDSTPPSPAPRGSPDAHARDPQRARRRP